MLTEIPGNDRQVYHYPDERKVADEDYKTEIYDDDDFDNNNDKSNRVLDRANKWYANDGKIVVMSSNGASATILTLTTALIIPGVIACSKQ